MRPLFHPSLVNGRFGDPALYVEMLFESRAVLFDLGDIAALAPRKVLRISHVFITHTHIDHFIGFDRLLRLNVGRAQNIALYGPQGIADGVHHKLRAYNWNLVGRFKADLVFDVTEIAPQMRWRRTRFRLKSAFAREETEAGRAAHGIIADAQGFHVRAAILDHHTPCLGYALEESAHVNVWKPRLASLDLPVGPWLRDLKHAIMAGKGDDHPIAVPGGEMPLGALRALVTVTAGQKIGYVADAAGTPANRQAIAALVSNADLLFIEAAFADADDALAAERAHLTTRAAGEIARTAQARRVEPFHFSPRYSGEQERLLDEVARAFCPAGIAGLTPNSTMEACHGK